MADIGFVELAAPLDGNGRGHFAVFIGRHRRLEITRVGHAVGTDGATARQLEFLAVILADKAAGRAFEHFDPVEQAARDDGNFLGFQINDAQFGAETQDAFLWHHKKFGIRREEIIIHHRFGGEIDVRGHADLGVHVPRCGHGAHAGDEGQSLIGMRHRVPAVLAQRGHVRVDIRRRFPERYVNLFIAVRMLHRWADAITPGAFDAFRRKSCARKLFAIQAIVAFLRAVHALRQGAGQGLGFEIVAKAGHIALMCADRRRGDNHPAGRELFVHCARSLKN